MLGSNKILKKLVDIEAVLKPGVGDKCKRSIVTNAPAPFGNALKRLMLDFSLRSYRGSDCVLKPRLVLNMFDMNLIYCEQKISKKKELVLVGDAPVTQAQYLSVLKGIYRPTQKQLSKFFSEFPGAEKPAYNISYIDALDYCNCLSKKSGLEECYKILKFRATSEQKEEGYKPIFILLNTQASGFRLPELEAWLYCANGNQEPGSETFYSGTDGSEKVFDYAWLGLNSNGYLHDVREKKPNGAGFYDMTGNVYEYVEKIMINDSDYTLENIELHKDVSKFLQKNPEYRFLGIDATQDIPVRAVAVGGDFLSPTSEVHLSKAELVMSRYLDANCLNSNRLFEYSIPPFPDGSDGYCEFLEDNFSGNEDEKDEFECGGYPRIDKMYDEDSKNFVFTGFRLSLVLKAKRDLK